MRDFIYVMMLALVAGCGVGNEGSGDSTVRLSGRIVLPTDGGQNANGNLVVSSVDVTGQVVSGICSGTLAIDSYFCDAPESAFTTSYFLASYTIDLGSPLTFYALVSTDDDSPAVVSSLGNMYVQRALQLMTEGVASASAITEARLELSTAFGGLDVDDDTVLAAVEDAIASQASAKGFSSSLKLSNLYALDFHVDQDFDGTDSTSALSADGITIAGSDFMALGPLIQANLGLASLTMVAAPPAPYGIPFILIEPLVLAATRDVVVSWSNAYADSYSIVVSPNPDGSGGQSLTATDTSLVVSNLVPGQVYYLTLYANLGAQQMEPIGGAVSSFRVSPDAP